MRRTILLELRTAVVLTKSPPWRSKGSGIGRRFSIRDRLLTGCRRKRWVSQVPRVRPIRRLSLAMWWIGLIVLAPDSSSDHGSITSTGSRS